MTSHKYHHPKVIPIKVMTPHRKTEIHQTVPRDAQQKAERERASSPPSGR